MTAKERLVELIKDSDIYIPSIDDDVAEDLADAILKEFVRREDVSICSYCLGGIIDLSDCVCNGTGIVVKEEK